MTGLNNSSTVSVTNVRRTILEFLQSVFYYDERYPWRSDPGARAIDIVNEFATNTAEIEKFPKIVLTRGDIGLRNVSINRSGNGNQFLKPDTKVIQDLASGTLILNVLSKQPIEAELIAEKILVSILGWDQELKSSKQIFKITDISMGSIQTIFTDSDVRVAQVPVYIRYDKDMLFVKSKRYYDVDLTIDGTTMYQSTDYWVFANLVTFGTAPSSGVDISMSYYKMDTMEQVTEAPIYAPDGDRTVFPFTYDIYGPYYVTSGLDMTLINSGLDTYYDYNTLLYSDLNLTVTQESGPRVHRQGHSYVLPGNIRVSTGAISYIPPFYISNAPGQVTKLTKATYSLQTGGTAVCNILKNSEVLPAYSGIIVTSGIGSLDASDVYMVDGDSLAIEVASVTDTPENLSFTIFLDYIQ